MKSLITKISKYRYPAIALLVVIVVITYWSMRGGSEAQILLTEPVQRMDVEDYFTATGTLEPKNYVEVGAQVSGQVQRIFVDEGQQVEQGELVAEIDATVFETKVKNAEAGLEGKRAQLVQLQAELELAQIRAARNQSLYEKNAVSEDTLHESLANEKILKAKITAMQADIKADSATLEGDKATLGYAKIYAPISGTVVSIAVREGQTLNANQSAPIVMKIADLTQLTLRAEVSEADVMRVRAGMSVYFTTFGGGDRRWYSSVRQVLPTPTVTNDVVLYQVLIDIENADGHLMDAMTTQAFFVRASAENVLAIPMGAIQRIGRNTQVRIQNGSNIQTVPVELGVRNRTYAEVRSGLTEGDIVVVGQQNTARRVAQQTGPLGGGRRF